jgi:type I restriction enzyme, S subunit
VTEKNNHIENRLPKDWKWVKLGEILTVSSGKGIKINSLQGGKYSVYGGNGLNGYHSEYFIEEPKLIIGRVGVKCGITHITTPKSWVTDNALIVEPKNDAFYIKFLKLKLGFENLNKLSVSTAQPVISGSKIYAYEILLPPKSIQQTIVSKIEELFSELDKGIEQLKSAQQQLKIYRHAVLKWAFEGKLTNENVKDDELPEGWKEVKLADVCTDVEYGSATKSKEVGKVPVLRMGNIQNGKFDWDDLVYTNDDDEIEKYLLKKNDVLFNRTNSAELVGKTAIYKGEKPAIFAGYLIRINRIESLIDANYLTYYLNTHKAKQYGNTIRSFGVNQSNINGTKLKTYPIPLAPINEQQNIVQSIESRLSIADKLEETITNSLQQAEALRQSILKKAFEGKLI